MCELLLTGNELEKAGLVAVTERREIVEDSTAIVPPTDPNFELTDEQRTALDHVLTATDAGEFSVTLIHGVSGSGKTEIYIRAMQRVIAAGKQAIFLVPEIVLTTQLVSRLSSRFSRIAVAHSGLTDAKRAAMWRRTTAGEIDVVIGTRGAVFAPCPNLGLICVDEEQETSFKNLRAPRFHVRDVAIMRGHLAGTWRAWPWCSGRRRRRWSRGTTALHERRTVGCPSVGELVIGHCPRCMW